ncbi:hypothetical protein SAMN04488029_0894 [Reichenbachiella faecimaris]|uniref:Uncharacterized protein n=2 Tax=Reichenbachiella faecimaris TaxID=692418 RepID=A0A1W2G798_REIFA|nr:hypothetical protein SAMN04488029_0894 [Reichenbachiella faecimaris]
MVITSLTISAGAGGKKGEPDANKTESKTITPVEISKVDAKWLNGDQPKLLTAMASSGTSKEQLNGSSMDVKAVLGGWHAQAVGQYKNYIYVAFSSGKVSSDKVEASKSVKMGEFAKLWIYNTTSKQGKLVELEKGYPHPCSIQITGNYLTIAIEAEYGVSQAALGSTREARSMAKIFDLSKDPNCSVEAGRITQEGMNSGGAGLTYHPGQKCWYMLMDQDMPNGKVAVYKTANENLNSWQKTPIAYYNRFGSGAGLNLITASDNSIWGLYYDTSHENLPSFSKVQMSSDQVMLFKLITPGGKPVESREVFTQIVNIEAPKIEAAGELLASRPGMRFGAGFRYENGKMEVLTCQRNMAKEFYINRTKISDAKKTQVMFVNMATAKGEIYCNSVSNTKQKYHEERNQTESWSGVLQSPVKANINYFGAGSVSKGGFGSFAKALPKWSDAIEKTTSAPMVLFYLEGTKDVVGKMVEFTPTKSTDKKRK